MDRIMRALGGIVAGTWVSAVILSLLVIFGWIGQIVHVAQTGLDLNKVSDIIELIGCVIPPVGAVLYWIV